MLKMNKSENDSQNYNKEICRICLKNGNLKLVHEKYGNEHLNEMLKTCLSIQIDPNDGLPQNICVNCIIELVQAFNFIRKFQIAKAALNICNKKNEPESLFAVPVKSADVKTTLKICDKNNDIDPKLLPAVPIGLIKFVDSNTNDDEFVLPDKSIDKKDFEIGNKKEFILVDRNIIRKIKNYTGQIGLPSPSDDLKQAKLKIICSNTSVNEIITTTVPVKTYSKVNPTTALNKEKPKENNKTASPIPNKINILSIETYNKNLDLIKNSIKKNVSNLHLKSLIAATKEKLSSNTVSKSINTNLKEQIETLSKDNIKEQLINKKMIKSVNENTNLNVQNKIISRDSTKNLEKINEIQKILVVTNITPVDSNINRTKSERTKSNPIWNIRNKMQKTRKNKRFKKKRTVFSHSSAKYHEQFVNFLTVAKTTDDDKLKHLDNTQEAVKTETFNIKDTKKIIGGQVNIQNNNEPKKMNTRLSTSATISPVIDNNTSKTLVIKNKLVTGYMKRFENKKECPICKKNFKYLEPHLRIHSHKELATLKKVDEKENYVDLFNCEYCDKKFQYKSSLLQHSMCHVNAKPYSCSICDKSFKEMVSLQRHYNMHTNSDLYKCDICKKRAYNIKSNLYRHQRKCVIKRVKQQEREM